MSNPIAGWYPDPSGDAAKIRYWDGHSWTEHIASAQQGAQQPVSEQSTEQFQGQPPAAQADQPGGGDQHGGAPEEPAAQSGTEQPAEQPTQQFATEQGAGHQAPGEQPTQQFTAEQGAGHQAPTADATQQLPGYQPTQQFAQQAGGYPAAGYGQHGHAHGSPQPGAASYAAQPAPSGQLGGYQQPHGAGQQGYGQPYGAGQQPYAAGQQPYGQGSSYGAPQGAGGSGGEGGGSGKGLTIGIIIAAVVLLGAVIWALVLLLGGGDDEPAPTPPPVQSTPDTTTPTPEPEPTPEPTDEQTTPPEPEGGHLEGGEIALGEELAVAMTGNDTWTGTLSLDEPTLVVIDVIADPESFSSDDLMIEVIGADGFTAENDDRGQFLNFGDANTLDPALGAELAAGEYEVTVRPYWGTAESDFTIAVREPELVEPGDTFTIDLAENEYWLAALDLEEDTSVVFDTVSTEGDPLLSILSEDGSVETMDDSPEGEGGRTDPYLEVTLSAGAHFITLADYWGDPMTAELSLTAADDS